MDFFGQITRRVVGCLIAALYWILSRTWRTTHIDRPRVETGPHIYAHWHGDELLLLGAFSGRGMAVLSSMSKDGQIMASALTALGYRVSRGSSSRGAIRGLKGLIDRVIDEKCEASLAVDGPRGPRHIVKAGIIALAGATTGYVVPGASAAKRKYVFKNAWNRCYLPLPFTRCVVVYGKPIAVPREVDDATRETIRLQIEEELKRLASEAELIVQRTSKKFF